MNSYTLSRFNCVRKITSETIVGNIGIGGKNPIRIQSMANTKTQDVASSVKQCIALAEAGSELIRFTAQNLEAAKALKDISKEFRKAGFTNPLVADIHFLPQTAMEAVEHVEKIRVNPGNFSDKKKGLLNYTDAQYKEELEIVREKFTPLVLRCKELGRAIRIGTNHGSLSDRIISRYGDTSFGMVEAALEFARICQDLNFKNLVFSFKASNTRIMTDTYRLASKMMADEGMNYPLHLGVTEAGFGRDARIKSAIGIGGLLFDGLGDTIRVSLTEDPVEEIPVAKEIVALAQKAQTQSALAQCDEGLDFYNYSRRKSEVVELSSGKLGGSAALMVAEILQAGQKPSDKAEISLIKKADSYESLDGSVLFKKYSKGDTVKLSQDLESSCARIIAEIPADSIEEFADILRENDSRIIFAPAKASGGRHSVGEARLAAGIMNTLKLNTPIFIFCDSEKLFSKELSQDAKINEASVYLGSLLCDGIGDIACVNISDSPEDNAQLCLDILQGARARKSKAEYIACPSCGRTLFNIQETAEVIKKHTEHMKNVTIAVMGCIVNGPGEMADADYGYVGGAPGKINLYKGKTCVQMNIPQAEALDRLLKLIQDDKA